MSNDLSALAFADWPRLLPFVAASAALTAGLIVLLMPMMRRYAMARPTARGLHTTPTPQGGGLAIFGAVEIAYVAWWLLVGPLLQTSAAIGPALLLAACAYAALGGADDVLTLTARFRLLAQFAVAAPMAVLTLGAAAPSWPLHLTLGAAAVACVGLVWFVNLTNFMDGMDGMTVVGMGVPTLFAGLAILTLRSDVTLALVCLAVFGGLLGFAPFNAPRARLFLGDVGSLPLGLVVGVAFLHLAARGHVFAALIAPLYYIADATITLGLRAARGEDLAQAHRSHFYQRAATGGMSAWGVLARVGALNAALAALATLALSPDPRIGFVALLVGATLVGATLRRLARGA